jgi:hypothetical protein
LAVVLQAVALLRADHQVVVAVPARAVLRVRLPVVLLARALAGPQVRVHLVVAVPAALRARVRRVRARLVDSLLAGLQVQVAPDGQVVLLRASAHRAQPRAVRPAALPLEVLHVVVAPQVAHRVERLRVLPVVATIGH